MLKLLNTNSLCRLDINSACRWKLAVDFARILALQECDHLEVWRVPASSYISSSPKQRSGFLLRAYVSCKKKKNKLE